MTARWNVEDIPSLEGKIAVVTGANSGLGWWTTRGLAAAGATVVMACRNTEKGEQEAGAIRQALPDADLEVAALDLADLASVQRFGEDFAMRHDRLDILCNNAGVMALPLTRTAQGFEMQIGTNHFGHFALTGALLDLLNRTAGARVVTVASMAHRWTRKMDLDDINWERKRYKKWDAYGKSKLANLLFTFELQRRLDKQGLDIKSNAAHPGYASTNLQFAGPEQENSRLGRLQMKVGNTLFGQPAAMGALPSLYACTAPDVASGEYYGPKGFKQMRGYPGRVGCREDARDPELARRLWEMSEELTGVKYLSEQ